MSIPDRDFVFGNQHLNNAFQFFVLLLLVFFIQDFLWAPHMDSKDTKQQNLSLREGRQCLNMFACFGQSQLQLFPNHFILYDC